MSDNYIGSICPMVMQVAHPAIYAALEGGCDLTDAQKAELAASPFLVDYGTPNE